MMTRRQAIKTTVFATTTCAALPCAIAHPASAAIPVAPTGPFTLPPLPYAFAALEPHIDARTMEIHHDKHHAAYVANLNKAWRQMPWGGAVPTFAYLENNWLNNPKFLAENAAIRNNGGGHYNHSLFWQMMKKGGGGEPKGDLAKAITKHFGSYSGFKDKLTETATKIFGSGWAWLAIGPDGQLAIEPTPNQDTPLSAGKQPLLGLDVWEHAYYLSYQNRRPEYITAWFNVINWDFVAERYAKFK